MRSGTEVSTEHKRMVLLLVCLAQFMVILDISIVNVALSSMREDLGLSQQGLQWVVNAYTITFGGLLLLGGRAADMFGQKKIFLCGIAIFGVASLVGGFARSEEVLIAARAVQGIGGAILSPATLTILATTFPEGRERLHAMGAWSAVAGVGGATGALIGGLLTDLISWRWIFFLNLPFVILGFFAAVRFLRTRNQRHAQHLDGIGALLVTTGLIVAVYAIVKTEHHGWASMHTLGVSVGAAGLLAWFVVHEARVAKDPLMPLSLWKIPSLAVANLCMFFMGAVIFTVWFALSLTMQNALEYSPTETGLAFLPQVMMIVIGAQVSSRMLHKTTPKTLVVIGSCGSATGLVWLSRMTSDTHYWSGIFVPGMLSTLGIAIIMVPLVVLAMAEVDRSLAGLASGLINSSRQIGGSIGLAALSTLAANYTFTHQYLGRAEAIVGGFDKAFLAAAGLVLFVGLTMLVFAPKDPHRRALTRS